VRTSLVEPLKRAGSEAANQTDLEEIPLGVHGVQQNAMKKWTSIRMVYLLKSLVLALAALYQSWAAVVFVITMLQVAVWTKFCPSLWLFERQGHKKTEI
jgi:hypothetical protein